MFLVQKIFDAGIIANPAETGKTFFERMASEIMTTIKRKIITIETRQRTVIRYTPRSIKKIWCEFCAAEVEMATPDEAVSRFGFRASEIYRRLAQGDLHFIEGENGLPDICVNSLRLINKTR